MLNLDPNREPVPPKDAATLLVLRAADGGREPEIFCVRRHAKSAFMGGALVFPGGKLDPADAGSAYAPHVNGVHPRATMMSDDADHALALSVCACRESLEEAAIVPTVPPLDDREVATLRQRLEEHDGSLPSLLEAAARRLETDALVPFARWITPAGEQRRYDARFFLTRLPPGQRGAHDDHEAISSMWARPSKILEAFHGGDLWLAPPTIRCLELLAATDSVEAALALAAEQSLLPICPKFVPGEPHMLVLPGHPEHDVSERRVSGSNRFELRGDRFVSAGS